MQLLINGDAVPPRGARPLPTVAEQDVVLGRLLDRVILVATVRGKRWRITRKLNAAMKALPRGSPPPRSVALAAKREFFLRGEDQRLTGELTKEIVRVADGFDPAFLIERTNGLLAESGRRVLAPDALVAPKDWLILWAQVMTDELAKDALTGLDLPDEEETTP